MFRGGCSVGDGYNIGSWSISIFINNITATQLASTGFASPDQLNTKLKQYVDSLKQTIYNLRILEHLLNKKIPQGYKPTCRLGISNPPLSLNQL